MKNQIQKFLVALALLAGVYQINAAVTFTITPTATSNTYNGIITLAISGITSGDTVVVQKFLDADSNIVIDSSSILWQQFQLTDGQAAVFKNGNISVTNFNVPGDIDGLANGSITAQLYPAMDFAQLMTAKYFFKLSSPLGHFTPVTNSIVLTNLPFAQSISGNVVHNGTNVPDAVIILAQPGNGGFNPIGGTVANNSGGYKIAASPGTYELVAVKTNFVANMNIAPNFTLNAGAAVVTNLPLTNATCSISGSVGDANNSSIGLSGYFLPVQTQDNSLLAIAFTDTNGNFSVGVTSNQWGLGNNGDSLLVKGYLPQPNNMNVDTTTGSVSGLTIALPKETAIFYGTVKSSTGTPLTGTQIEAQDNNTGYSADGVVFTNGNYVASALGGTGDPWQVQYDQDGPSNYIYSQANFDQNGGTNINTGQAIQVNFTGLSANNTISGNVQDVTGSPVAGLGINANTNISGLSYSVHADTDTNGNYSMNVANGVWDVSVNCGNGGDGLQNIYTNGNAQCPSDNYININNASASGVDFVIQLTGDQFYGYVTDQYGNPIAGVTVSANDGMGDTDTGVTDASGYYTIIVTDGTWTLSVDCDQLNTLGYECVGEQSNSICCDNSSELDFTTQLISPPTYPFTAYGFSAYVNGTNSNGTTPYAGLTLSSNSSILYGTAFEGGANDDGAVFSINTNGTGFLAIYSFTGGNDGAGPDGNLILYSNVLYGTVPYAGTNNSGGIFKLNTNGAFKSLYAFTGLIKTNGEGILTNGDGANPYAGLVGAGTNLFGVSAYGGTNGAGTIFVISTNGTGFKVLHTFGLLDAATKTYNSDGAEPYASLILSGSRLYGTANFGGVNGYGTIFAINTNGTGFNVLYAFTGTEDGAYPAGSLLLSSNTLFGTTSSAGEWNAGTVFALSTNGNSGVILYSFTGGNDGAVPQGALTLSSNILYGTATFGGLYDDGTVFAINTNNLYFTPIYTFTGNNDGANPYGNLVLSQNTLYGTASAAGFNGNGTVFAISLSALYQPLVQSQALSNGQFQMTVFTVTNQTCTVQMTTNLPPVNWITLLVTNPVSAVFQFTDTHATNQERFYRVEAAP